MRLLSFVLDVDRRLLVFAIALSVASGFAGAALMGYIGAQFTNDEPLGWVALLVFVGLVIFSLATGLVARWILIRLVSQRTLDLQMELARRLIATPLPKVETIGSPRMFGVLTEDARAVSEALIRIPVLVISTALVAGCFAYLAWLSPIAVSVLIATALPVIVMYQRLNRRVRRLISHFFVLRDERYVQYEALSHGTKELQMDGSLRQRFISRHLRPKGQEFRAAHEDVIMAHEVANSWSQSAYFVFVLALLVLIRYDLVASDILAAYALIALYMRTAIVQLTSVIPEWAQANAALGRIIGLDLAPDPDPDEIEVSDVLVHEEGSAPPVPTSMLTAAPDGANGTIDTNGDHAGAEHDPDAIVEIEAQGLGFAYDTGERDYGFVLGPMDFRMASGEVVFITGGNGSGKTTLMKVLCALYEPTEGTLRCNGQEITTADGDAFRARISALFADGFLFEELVGIGDGSTEASDAAVRYLDELDLTDKVTVSEGRFSTTKLSTGERKRLALLGAFLQDRPVYAFDEWAANQDPVFKRVFYRSLLPELRRRQKLVIVISHDDHYFDAADRVLHLADGMLVDTSSPAATSPDA
ncbi:MAG: ATP-binding cassette domain-containing protein [Actinomycetota bacterium]